MKLREQARYLLGEATRRALTLDGYELIREALATEYQQGREEAVKAQAGCSRGHSWDGGTGFRSSDGR